ncbi:alpha-N-arabinofuranosidase [Fimbriimonas ginsengisoli]|uniref:non-reducing end alpha-L-arabinofuranosidase n=1 Tax=Fimbriimonas ginsengisoli Gsoil 348 TaxID=661478 RepID=A0A068NQS9_FIMGI|nr:alpha-L-arabinofuranosidase C-terminal domain-containing protein [Fimbriimonas ginsengisoli]AIE85070.1 alpha-L-arabinofuranosidase domain protein [Fimbriimonas ginsengisoli Gsoil 348]
MDAVITLLPDEPYGHVSPRLYGHFAEHLGRCCYDGLWVGRDNVEVEHVDGFRKDVVEALRAMPTPLLRWPGGCYADHYHWRDGIGPERAVRLGLSCGRQVLDDNTLGTHEFLHFCQLIGAEPYLAGNMGSGSVQELCDWVEYCNTKLPTTLGKERAANGHTRPFDVKLWGVGNENWGCGGNYDPESYALEYRRYSMMMQHVDPSIEMVVCGHDRTWNQRCLEKLRGYTGFVDHYSIHRYWIEGGHGTEFSETDYYALLAEAERTEEFIVETRAMIEDVSPKKRIGIALDEWGVWHPEARTWGPGPVAEEIGDYSQAGTMRDALATAVGFEVFHRQCASLSMANLAQIVNVLHAPIMTEGTAFWVTPTYHLLRMHRPHIGAQAYRCEVETTISTPQGAAISATATSGGVTVTNRHLTQAAVVQVPGSYSEAWLLSAEPSAQNSAAHPDNVSPTPLKLSVEGTFELPPHSVATLVR